MPEVKDTTERKVTHTPGPWMFGSSGPVMAGYSQPFAVVAGLKPLTIVAGVFGDVVGGVEVAERNAGIIAAAPELLDVVKRFRALEQKGRGLLDLDVNDLLDAYRAADAVITRAEGK